MSSVDLNEEVLSDRLIESNSEMQRLIDEINAGSDAEDETDGGDSSASGSPFACKGTIYDGMTGEIVAEVREET